MNYLLDTNVISELVAAKPEKRVLDWIQAIEPLRVYISVITIGEIQKGIEKLPDSGRKERLAAWLQQDLLARFDHHILSLDTETLLIWGRLTARLELAGRPISALDALLAASAIRGELTLVTRNSTHFMETGVSLVNPWEL